MGISSPLSFARDKGVLHKLSSWAEHKGHGDPVAPVFCFLDKEVRIDVSPPDSPLWMGKPVHDPHVHLPG